MGVPPPLDLVGRGGARALPADAADAPCFNRAVLRAVALMAVVLACAPPVRADEASDARAHYERGEEHYAAGRYDEAIAEYEAAYRLKPHWNVLYNIAQAYERLLEYGKSVTYFELYLAEAPANAEKRPIVENRLRLLRNLPARLSITTFPEHVRVRVTGGGQTFEGVTPHLFKVPAGTYEVALDHDGWESERHRIRAEIGQPYFYQYRLQRSTSPVTIFTRPRGARVFIDDKLVGQTPFAEPVEVGKHRLLIEHPEYPWYRQEIEVKPGEPLRLELKLRRPARSGRTELVLASMVYGGAAGPMLVAALSTNSDFLQTGNGLLTLLLSSAAGIGAGFLASFLPTRDGIKVGHSSVIIGGGAWGTLLGASLSLGLQLQNQYTFGLSLLGGAVGITTGVLLARLKDPTAGPAALMNSGGFWGTAASVLLTHAIFRTPSAQQFGWFMLGGVTAGVLTGSLLGWKLDVTRTRVLLIDVGGLVGTGLGFALGTAVGASSQDDTLQSGSRFALGGMALGLLAAAVGTRSYKGDIPPVEALLLRDQGRFRFALPRLEIEPVLTPEGPTTRLNVVLAKGRF